MANPLVLAPGAVGQAPPGILYGQVSSSQPAPSSFSSPLYVVIPQWQPDYFFEITDWPACHGSTLPAHGASVVLVRDDQRNLRCVWWDGSASFPSATVPGLFLPETYGAVGDGVTDDTIALNACVTAAAAYSSGQTGATVLINKRSYAHAGPVKVLDAEGLRIMGTGGRLQWGDGPTLSFTGGAGTGALCTLQSSMTAGSPSNGGSITTSAPAPSYLGDGGFPIQIDSEVLWVYSGASTTTWVVRRAFRDTTAASHSIGANINPAYGAMICGNIFGFTLENFRVQYTNASFTGDLVDFDWYPPNFADPTNWKITGCAFRGNNTASGARSLLRLNHTIIGSIKSNHFGERNGPAIRCGDGDYCVGVVIDDQNTFNSGAAGTYAIQTTGGCEAISIKNNTFEPIAGLYAGAWQHTAGVAWHVSFEDNWMGDQTNNTYPWVDIVGQLNSFTIMANRFTTTTTADTMVKFETGSAPNGGVIAANYFDNGNIVSNASTGDTQIFSNVALNNLVQTGSNNGLTLYNHGDTLALFPYTASTSKVALRQATAAYDLDVSDNAKGIRLLNGGGYWFRGTAGNQDAVNGLVPSGSEVQWLMSSTPIVRAVAAQLAFYNATPVSQPNTSGTTAGFTAGTGTTVVSGSTFTGNTGTTAYTIGDIVNALKRLGLLAS